MKNKLSDILKTQIAQHGPMDVGQYMALALGHPEHGYYMKRDPFGVDGDFTTAPEISQMFGEMIGAWAAHSWIEMGRPERFSLLECGPGRGTLMADMMRATAGVEGFHAACEIHLLEISPVLKEKQAGALADFSPQWHGVLESVPDDVPLIVIGNEFLDALPVRQFVCKEDGWYERVIGVEDGVFVFMLVPQPVASALLPEYILHNARLGGEVYREEGEACKYSEVYEYSGVVEGFVSALCKKIKKSGGAALFIDYGHVKSGAGETLQALYKHEYVGVFEHIGDADLTAHVDFDMLGRVIKGEELSVFEPVEQGEFLKMLGIGERAAYLKTKADKNQQKDIESALHRLTHADEMGTLFKVIGFEC